MRTLTLLSALALSAAALAQSPLNTLAGGTNQGNVGGGIYFDLQINTTVTITRLDFRCGANTVAGSGTLTVYLGPSTYAGNVTSPALWTPVASATTTVAPSAVSSAIFTTPFALAPGNYGVALASAGFNHGYTNGVTCSSTTIPGSCTNSVFSNTEMTLRAGAAQNLFLAGGVNSPRVFNGAIHYTLGGTPISVAAWQPYGKGCYAYYRTFYQQFPNPVGFNLGTTAGIVNPVTAIKLAFNSSRNGYDITASNTPIVTPTSAPIALVSADTTFLASSVLPNNQMPFVIPHPLGGTAGVATDLEISTEGYIVPSPATMPNSAVPSPANFLAFAPRWAPHWKSMNPLAAGASMHVEYDVASGAVLVTWNNVADTGYTTTSTFQAAFFFNGDVEYRYGVMSQNGGGSLPVMVGWTEGGNGVDPGTVEIATSLPLATYNVDNVPLTLSLGSRPLLGTTANLNTSSIPAGTSIGIIALGFSDLSPGLDLGFLGMPLCRAWASYDATAQVPITGSTNTFSLLIPNLAALNGGLLFGQTLTVSPGFNSLGVIASNGLRMRLGSL